MLTKVTMRRFGISSLLLLVALILYSFPEELNQHIDTVWQKQNIYLIDLNDFVVLTEYNVKDKANIDYLIKDVVSCLTVNSSCETDGFSKIIPQNTKLLDYDLNDSILKLNFNKEFLNISAEMEEKLIESLIFSLTEIDGVEKIMIFIDGERLMKLPHSSKKLDLYLDRSFGINKVYNLDKITNTSMVTIYYLNQEDNFVPVSYISNDNNDKLEIIINAMKANVFYNNNLSSLLNYQVELIDYEINDEIVSLNFNSVLLDSVFNGELKEEVKFAIYYSVRDTLNIDSMVFNIEDKKIDYLGLAN